MQNEQGKLLPLCLICNLTPPEGIKGGIRLGRHFLCDACQKKMVACAPETPFYRLAYERLKGLWSAPDKVGRTARQRIENRLN